jgi:predicted RNA-binding Zn-ribbon protein involved in translation (DUF1610 family)
MPEERAFFASEKCPRCKTSAPRLFTRAKRPPTYTLICDKCGWRGPVASTPDKAAIGWNAFAKLERQQ